MGKEIWRLGEALSAGDSEFARSAAELLRSTARHIIRTTGVLYLTLHLVATVTWPEMLGWKAWAIVPLFVTTMWLALKLLPRRLWLSQAVWQAGLTLGITMAIYLFRWPTIAFCYSLLPLMAVVTVGGIGGLVSELLVIGLTLWIGHQPAMPPIPVGAVIIGGGLTGWLGWASTRSLLTVTEWSIFNFEQARQVMEQALEQRVELKQMQADLMQANAELTRLSDRLQVMYQVAEEARRTKEEFVANVSHELRTPLNMIIGFSEMITQAPQVYGVQLPAALLADITAIQRNSRHLAKLVDDVLDLSQIEAGRMALSKSWVSLEEIIQAAVIAVRALFESKGLYLETEIPSDLPMIFCDSTRIRQVVLNLLSNAGRFTEQGGVLVTVRQEEHDLLVSVADTGPGIAPEDQSKLFEPFRQLDGSIRRKHGGSGLGLSISKRFVEMHNGKMWLESKVGMGTTIHFQLPIDVPVSAPLEGYGAKRWFNPYQLYEARPHRTRRLTSRPAPRFVLLDSENVLERLFTRYIEGADVVSVQSMEEALFELRRSPAQALVMNMLFSRPDDVDDIRTHLSDLPYDTPAIVCWVPGGGEAARKLGIVRYLLKPVTRETLLDALDALPGEVSDVLLVDDEPDVLQLFGRILASTTRSYQVLRATHGEQALDMLRQRRPDVMLLDLMMPDMDGFQVLREKARDPSIRDIPVLVVSARDPIQEPIVSDALVVMRGGGLSVRDLLACIQTVTAVLVPTAQQALSTDPALLEMPAE